MTKTIRLPAILVLLVSACSSSPGERATQGTSALGRRPANVPSNYVATPNGYFDPSCIARVEPGETARADGTIEGQAGAVRKAAACAAPRFDRAGNVVPSPGAGPAPAATYNGWVESYNTTSIGAVKFLSSTWVVPATPSAGNQGQTIFFFNGLEGVPTVQSILQPVIAYENGTWTATSWNCCKSGTTFTGNTIAIHPGDVIVGTVTGTSCNAQSGLCSDWVIETLDQTTGQSSVLHTQSWGDALNWVFPAVLEVYGVSQCSDFPATGKITFYDQQFTTVSGSSGTSASWSLGLGSVSPDCSYGGQNDGSSLTLDFTAAAAGSGSGGGNFAASCSGLSLGGSVLAASCRDVAGHARSTSIDLNTCVTNQNGVVSFLANGNYAASCSGCALGGSTMTCQCRDVSGQARSTSMDLNAGISNCNGVLKFGGC